MSANQIPPIKGKDYKENFIPLFFERLMDMKIVSESQTMNMFLDDSKFIPAKRSEIKSVDQVVHSSDA
jgi:hypothetical protein